MAIYTMTPYAFSFYPRNARGGERRPIADLDGKGLTARSILESALELYQGDDLKLDTEDQSKSLLVRRFYPGAQHTFVEFGLGRGGLVGTLHQRSGAKTAYAGDDHNEARVRGMFIFPEGGHEVFWLSERAGNLSAYSYLYRLLRDACRNAAPVITTKVDPVADWAAVKAWASKVLVKEIRFDAPRQGGSTQAMDINGLHGDVRIIIKPRGLSLNRVVKDTGPDAEAVYGFLSGAPLVSQSDISADTIIQQGWGAKVAFTNQAGRQRSFGLDLDEAGPTLVYPVGIAQPTGRKANTGAARAYVPTDEEFRLSCAEFLEDIAGRLPVGVSVAAEILRQN